MNVEEFLSHQYSDTDDVTISANELKQMLLNSRECQREIKTLRDSRDAISKELVGLTKHCDMLVSNLDAMQKQAIDNPKITKLKKENKDLKQKLDLCEYYKDSYKAKYEGLQLKQPPRINLYG